jgi:predicted dehydrogenase
VLCEKRRAPTLGETRAALADVGDLVHVALERRFDPAFVEARRLVAAGALGTLYREGENPCPGLEALHALRIAATCDRSRAERRPLRIDEVDDDAA